MLRQTRWRGGWRRGHEGERNKINLRLRGSKGKGALEVNSGELSRPGLQVLCFTTLWTCAAWSRRTYLLALFPIN